MNIFNMRKIIAAGAIMTILFSSYYGTVQAASNEYKHIPISREELNNAERQLKILKKRYPDMEESSFITDNIQAPLIKYNPNLLKKATKKHDDGLRKIYIIDKNNTENIGKGIFTISAGNIALTQGFINAKMALEPGTYTPKSHKDYDVYATSCLAAEYAREASRWYYNEKVPQDNMMADEFAVNLLDNVPTFSVGGILMTRQRTQTTTEDDFPAETDEYALYDLYSFILNTSQNRVGFTNDDTTTNQLLAADKNGDYWSVFPPPQFDVTKLEYEGTLEDKTIMTRGEDRAYYTAGQITWAIKNKAWDSSHVTFSDAHKYFKDLPKNIGFTAIIATTDQGNWKLIDWYLSDSSYLTESQQKDLNMYVDGMKASFDDAENW